MAKNVRYDGKNVDGEGFIAGVEYAIRQIELVKSLNPCNVVVHKMADNLLSDLKGQQVKAYRLMGK